MMIMQSIYWPGHLQNADKEDTSDHDLLSNPQLQPPDRWDWDEKNQDRTPINSSSESYSSASELPPPPSRSRRLAQIPNYTPWINIPILATI